MTYIDWLIALGIAILVTIIYILLRKFVAWTIDDDVKYHKKQGHAGLNKGTIKERKKWAL